MKDDECVLFLQWALPKMGAQWPGFRKVRGQVCKRVARRLKSLGLPGVSAYRAYLETHDDEWTHLDELCWIPISRFYRDRAVFDYLEQTLLPQLAEETSLKGAGQVQAWSAGCGAGEEPYTLNLLWRLSIQGQFPNMELRVLATDIDRQQLDRARTASYSRGSLKELPKDWMGIAFEEDNGRYSLRPEFRQGIEFRQQDLRRELPDGPFSMILCRNVAFTYFDESSQREMAVALRKRLTLGGALVLGRHEALPAGATGFKELDRRLRIYCRDHEPGALITMARCTCTNLAHGHGVHCEREALEPAEICEDCQKKEAMEWPLGQQVPPPGTPASS
jgi:chemotaxis protein methyltransferase CheR